MCGALVSFPRHIASSNVESGTATFPHPSNRTVPRYTAEQRLTHPLGMGSSSPRATSTAGREVRGAIRVGTRLPDAVISSASNKPCWHANLPTSDGQYSVHVVSIQHACGYIMDKSHTTLQP